MALQTKGFSNTRSLGRHFSAHGSDFGALDASDYEQQADGFLGSAPAAGVLECIRSGGDKVRYDPRSEAYGVIDSTGTIRTFFKPVPCAHLSAIKRVAEKAAGRCHGQADNLGYFTSECAKW
jgi:pyocin large subunit-like protein